MKFFQQFSLPFSGPVTAASFIPTSATVPTNGLYLSAANTPAISANSLVVATFAGVASANRNLTFTNGASSGSTNATIGTNSGNLGLTPSSPRVVLSHASVPIYQLNVSGSGTDLKHWDILANAGGFTVQAGNDADGASTAAYTISRGTTYNVASHHFYTSTVAGTAVEGFEILNTGGADHVRVQSGTGGVLDTSAGALTLKSAGTAVASIAVKSGSGVLNIASIPISSVGLASGDIYSNAGVLTIVP